MAVARSTVGKEVFRLPKQAMRYAWSRVVDPVFRDVRRIPCRISVGLENRALRRSRALDHLAQCYLCSGTRHRMRCRIAGLTYVECEECGLVFVNPRLPPDVYGRVYGHRYWFARRVAHGERPLSDICFQQKRFQAAHRLLTLIGERVPRPELMIDYGCGDGSLLAAALAGGWNACGLEISPSLVEFSRSRYSQVQIFLGEEEMIDHLGGECASLIFLRDVLEHFYAPVDELRRVVRFLQPGGHLYIETVDADDGFDNLLSAWRHAKPFEHPYLFRARHVEEIVHRAGLEVVERFPVPTRCHLLTRRPT